MTGTVTDGGRKLKVAREGAVKGESEIPWPDGVVGLVREPKLFKELNLKAGRVALVSVIYSDGELGGEDDDHL